MSGSNSMWVHLWTLHRLETVYTPARTTITHPNLLCDNTYTPQCTCIERPSASFTRLLAVSLARPQESPCTNGKRITR